MLKTAATVRHRDYVPSDWFAIEFCDVNFTGFRAKEMEKKWKAITYERYNKYNSLYEKNKTKIQNLYDKSKSIYEQVNASKPFYRFWYNKTEKEILSEANKLSNQAYKLEEENEEIGHKRFFNAYECHRKIEDFLQKNGFVLTSIYPHGNNSLTDIEVWTLEEP